MQKSESQIGADFTDYTDFWGGSTLHLCNLRNLRKSVILTMRMTEEYKYKGLTGKIIGCAMRVYSFLGNGFQEVIYQRALALELEGQNRRLPQITLIPQMGGEAWSENLCNLRNLWQSAVLTITELQNVHYAQIINYLTAYKLEIGLLIIKS